MNYKMHYCQSKVVAKLLFNKLVNCNAIPVQIDRKGQKSSVEQVAKCAQGSNSQPEAVFLNDNHLVPLRGGADKIGMPSGHEQDQK